MIILNAQHSELHRLLWTIIHWSTWLGMAVCLNLTLILAIIGPGTEYICWFLYGYYLQCISLYFIGIRNLSFNTHVNIACCSCTTSICINLKIHIYFIMFIDFKERMKNWCSVYKLVYLYLAHTTSHKMINKFMINSLKLRYLI